MSLKSIAKFCCLFLMLMMIVSCEKFSENIESAENFTNLEQKQTYEGGTRFSLDGSDFQVLMLKGTFREMGRQYGFLMNESLVEIHDLILNDLLSAGWSHDSVMNYSKYLERTQPQLIKEIIYGISETSSLSKEQQFICSSFLRLMPDAAGTSITAWGDYTANMPLMSALNWDCMKGQLNKYREFLNLVIYKPKGIGNSFAEVNFAGSVFFQAGINNRRLFMNIQQAGLSDPLSYNKRPLVQYEAYTLLLDYASLNTLEAPMSSLQSNKSIILNASDVNASVSFQCPPYAVQNREAADEGFLVATNHFVDHPDGWPLVELPAPPADFYTQQRFTNALNFGSLYYGGLNLQRMMDCMNKLLDQGGCTFSDHHEFSTLFQIIAVPVDLHLYIQVPGRFTWKKIYLQALFDD